MKYKIVHNQLKRDFSFEELYEEISHAWERRAKELQARRWEKIRHQKTHQHVTH